MAPELISQTGGGPCSDIWSLGCTVLELLIGEPPYWKLNANLALFRMVEDVHPPLVGVEGLVREFLLCCFLKVIRFFGSFYLVIYLFVGLFVCFISFFDVLFRTRKRDTPLWN